MKESFFSLLMVFTMLAVALASPVSAKKSNKYYMDKVIENLKKGNVQAANKYSKKLPEYSSEKCVTKMSKKQKKAFNTIIKKETNTKSDFLGNNVCCVTDIDNDGVAELLVESGDYDAVRVITIYKYKNGKVKKLKGTVPATRLGGISKYPDRRGVLLCHYGGGGSMFVMVDIKNDTIKTKEIASISDRDSNGVFPYVRNGVKSVKKL